MALRVVDFTLKLTGITEVLRRWQGAIADLDGNRRDRIAAYADAIAGTLARAAEAFATLEADARNRQAAHAAARELGRLGGYIESLVGKLHGRIDGRRLAGIRRRLEGLADSESIEQAIRRADATRMDRLAAAEGYFRALADELRA